MTTSPDIAIDENAISWEFVRASGPGGQNVNKVASAVQLRFDLNRARGLSAAVRSRLIHLAGRRVNAEGVLIIEARRLRSQERNRREAIERLRGLIRSAMAPPPRPRRPTRPGRAARERRLAAKHRRARVKQGRGRIGADNE